MDTPERWHPIAPASDEPGKQRPPPDRRKRRQAIAVACIPCRTGKAKCDGLRPRCNRCRDNDVVCQYDVAEGVSRAERMKLLKRDSMSGKVDELERIVNFLRSGSDLQASTVLARLRLGERVEEVAKSLPATSSTSGQSKPPSSLPEESAGTSGNALSHDSMNTLDEKLGTPLFRHGSSASITSSMGHRPSWPNTLSNPSPALCPSAKGKQLVRTDEGDSQPFLSILYDRDDILLAISESEDESEDEDNTDQKDDTRFTQQVHHVEMGALPLNSPADSFKGPRSSPHRQTTVRSIYATHLLSRQPIVNTIRIHPNLDIRTLFGNTALSSNVQANSYLIDAQDLQTSNLAIPTWSMLPVNTRPDPGSLRFAVPSILEEATNLMNKGTPAHLIIETHPNIAALFDEEEYRRSGILSQWAVGMVHSALLKGNTFTCFACMYLFWYLMRWMISPSEETYRAIPEWLRPTPNQLFMPHINIVDFVAWPAFRELVVQIPTMQERMEWLMDMCLTVQCDWSFSTKEALARNEETGLSDLCPAAKETMRDLSSWSVAPSFRGYVSNADTYVRIRTEAL
ncbi:hypothetical protein J1614_003570 [Plenodomus biglobosus]|nr:hypothetical protein J1614_003570 [Plenodomus biglobosus]